MNSSSSGVSSTNVSLSLSDTSVTDSGDCQRSNDLGSFLLYNSFINLEENYICEFKGHCAVSINEINPRDYDVNGRCSKAPISRALCGFLNTPHGGTIYLGVLDSSRIKGLVMTSNQTEHFLCNLEDTLDRFTPKVLLSRIQVRFIPVRFDDREEDGEEPRGITLKSTPGHVHRLRTFEPCWCLTEQRALFRSGILVPIYVIELTVLPWAGSGGIYPMFQNEEGAAYSRGHGGQSIMRMHDILQRTKTETQEALWTDLKRAKEKLDRLKREASVRGFYS